MSHIIWFIRIGKRFRLIECDVFSCSSYGNDIVFCQVNQFYIQGHDMLIKPPAKPIDFRSLLIIYYSNDIYRSNQIVGTSIFSAQIRNYDVAVMRTLVMTSLIVQLSWQHKVHFNYLKSLNSTFFKQCWMHWSDSPFKSFLKSVLWSDRKQSNLYFHSAYSLSVIYNPLPVVHFFPARNTTRGTPSYRLMESNLSFLTLLWRDIPLVIRSRSF